MKTQENKIENDNLAAIGIGAMIVFIALILVAAVAAAVIIQTAEKLQQNAQSTGDDTTDEMSGKVQILNVFVDDPTESFVVYFRLAAGSDDTAVVDILWQVFCEDPDGGGAGPPAVPATDRLAGDFTDSAAPPVSKVFALDAVPVGGAAAIVPVATVEAGKGYRVSLDVDDTGDVPAGTNDCAPDHLFTNNIKASLYVHVIGGGSTYDVLVVNDQSRGAVVV
jgi:flagellin FlaB